MPIKSLPSSPSLGHLKYQAKDLLGLHDLGTPQGLARIREFYPKFKGRSDHDIQMAKFSLADAQRVVAREYGFANWPALKQHVEALARAKVAESGVSPAEMPAPASAGAIDLESLAADYVLAFESGESGAIQRLNDYYHRSFTWDDVRAEVWRQVYKVRQAKARPGSFALDDAKWLIARDAGFGNWNAFLEAVTKGEPPPGEPYILDLAENQIRPRRQLADREWDRVIGVMKERRISALSAEGHMTDGVLKRIAELDCVTHLELGGSRQLTDDGLLHLANMPQLEHLSLSEYPGGRITDRGIAVVRHLRKLRRFHMSWQSGVSDAGVANLAFCDELEVVELMGSPTGDGAIRALRGKPRLREFKTGRLVTDAGLPMLHEFPVFKTWRESDAKGKSTPPDAKPNQLMIDGPFTDEGIATLAGLDGLFGLFFFWHASALTPDGLKMLRTLPRLGFLGCEGKLCDDTAMRHIAAIPRLRMLMAQGTVASDDGFEALSGSQSLESIWGRECPNLGGRGFAALSRMPSLRVLGVSCKHVDDDSLALLPRFPQLRELTPIDVTDAGFRHMGRCGNLEKLTCMYCRDTTDVATGHIAGLSKLKSYYAGLTQITDRSLEILGRMQSLEKVEFYECNGITDAGLPFLARLPRLREIEIFGSPNISLQGTKVFPARTNVKYLV